MERSEAHSHSDFKKYIPKAHLMPSLTQRTQNSPVQTNLTAEPAIKKPQSWVKKKKKIQIKSVTCTNANTVGLSTTGESKHQKLTDRGMDRKTKWLWWLLKRL